MDACAVCARVSLYVDARMCVGIRATVYSVDYNEPSDGQYEEANKVFLLR
jgi:hypothetical protein